MDALTSILDAVGNAIFAPLRSLSPVLVIAVLAVVLAAASLLVFRWTSDQERLRNAKAGVFGHLLGVLLFRHDLKQIFRGLFLSIGRSLANLRFLVVPMLVMFVPLFLLAVQMDLHLGDSPLSPGESTTLRARVANHVSLDDVNVVTPPGLRVETPGVRISVPEEHLHEVDWRLRAEKPGSYDVTVRSGGTKEVKRVVVGGIAPLVSPTRDLASLSALLLHPSEKPLPKASPFTSIDIQYDPARYRFLGISWAWWTLFLVFYVVALFVLKKPLRVAI